MEKSLQEEYGLKPNVESTQIGDHQWHSYPGENTEDLASIVLLVLSRQAQKSLRVVVDAACRLVNMEQVKATRAPCSVTRDMML